MKMFEISSKKNKNGRRKFKAILYTIFPDSCVDEANQVGTMYNKNGITWLREYCEKALPSINGMSLRCEFTDEERTELLGHGDTGIADGEPIYEDAVVIGTFTKGYIEDIETEDGVITACIGEGEIDAQCYHNFVTKLEANAANGIYPSGSIEIMHTENNNEIIYKYGYKDLGRIPTEFIHSGYALLGITPADDSAKLIELSTVIYQSINAFKEMYQNVYNIDTQMTELRKVTDESSESYSKFLKNAGSSAKEIGTTISDLVSSTADFARLGYTFADSQELAKVANIYSVVGDEVDSIDTATKSLISTMTAFSSQMDSTMSQGEFAMSIIDKFNEVGNNYAISSGGIGDALERSASSMAAANNTLDETIALITAANTVVQDPDSVGTAFKTISMRIRGAKTELEEAGLETDGMVESTAKLREEIMALSGVDIMEDETTFKSTYDIMDELAQKWQDLTDIQQASITELIAGKRQGNIVSSLMENFDIAREALQTSLDSEGSAMAEHEKWMESLEAKVLQLRAAWEELSQAFMNDSFLKGLVDAGTTVLSTLTKIIDTFGTLPTLLTIAAGAMSFKNVGELINQFQFRIILRIEYAHEVFTNGNMNDIMLKLVA